MRSALRASSAVGLIAAGVAVGAATVVMLRPRDGPTEVAIGRAVVVTELAVQR